MTFAAFSTFVGILLMPFFAPFLMIAGILKGLGLWK